MSLIELLSTAGTFAVISLIIAVIAVVLLFIFIVPEKKKAKLNKFGKFLHNTFNFKYLIVEKILQALYMLLTAFFVIFGFLLMFVTVDVGGFFSSETIWLGGYGLLLMILGPIIVRLIYELLMLAVLVVKNVISINNKLENNNSDVCEIKDLSSLNLKDEIKNTENEISQNVSFCPNCGTAIEGAAFCKNCGTKV